MQIQILSVSITTTPTAKGSYQTADVAYKNLTYQGKVEGKKVMSFGATKDAFATLATAQAQEIYEVNVVKNDKGYNDWVSMVKGGGATSAAPNKTAAGGVGTAPARTSTYETPEERAKRQVFIIRQSSISSAIAALSVGSKGLKEQEIFDLARKIESYVVADGAVPAPTKIGGESGFEDLPDFPNEAE